jgi:hypothetical protein
LQIEPNGTGSGNHNRSHQLDGLIDGQLPKTINYCFNARNQQVWADRPVKMAAALLPAGWQPTFCPQKISMQSGA